MSFLTLKVLGAFASGLGLNSFESCFINNSIILIYAREVHWKWELWLDYNLNQWKKKFSSKPSLKFPVWQQYVKYLLCVALETF